MKKLIAVLMGAAAIAGSVYVGSRFGGQTAQAQSGPPLQTRIGLLNLSRVINDYKVWISCRETLKQKKQAIEDKDIKPLKENIERHKKGLATLNPLNPQDQEKQTAWAKDLRRLEQQLQEKAEEANNQLGKEEQQCLLNVINDIDKVVKAYAPSRQIEMVLQFNDSLPPGLPLETVALMGLKRKVTNAACLPVYYDPRLEITQDIIIALNGGQANIIPASAPGR